MKTISLAAIAGAVTLSCAAVLSPAIGQPGSTAGASQQEETEAQISARLAAAMRAEIGDRVTSASSQDIEGYMMFVISQRTYTAPVISGALDSIATNAPENLRQAVSNIRIALLRRKVNRGTAALVGSGGGFGTSNFAQPGLSVGGGSSNYTF